MVTPGQIIKWCFCAFLWLIVVSVCLPVITSGPDPRNYRDLSNAKEIYFGLKMYEGDHDGKFPSLLPDGSPITTANQAYRVLIPEYLRKEAIFYSEGSAWTPKEPDNEMEGDRKLAAGENAFAYVPNLMDASDPSLPLVVTAFLEGQPGVYGDSPSRKGGIPDKHGIVVVSVDGSGHLLPVRRKKAHSAATSESGSLFDESQSDDRASQGKPPQLRRIKAEWSDERLTLQEAGKNIFEPRSGWLAPNQMPLNPE